MGSLCSTAGVKDPTSAPLSPRPGSPWRTLSVYLADARGADQPLPALDLCTHGVTAGDMLVLEQVWTGRDAEDHSRLCVLYHIARDDGAWIERGLIEIDTKLDVQIDVHEGGDTRIDKNSFTRVLLQRACDLEAIKRATRVYAVSLSGRSTDAHHDHHADILHTRTPPPGDR